MKTNIRYGMFETNSSSLHSIALQGNDTKFDFDWGKCWNDDHWDILEPYVKDGTLYVRHEELVFEKDRYGKANDFYTKLCFALASSCWRISTDEEFELNEKTEMLVKAIHDPHVERIAVERPKGMLTETTDDPFGYIDHQSADSFDEFMCWSWWGAEEQLNRYLFDPEIIVVMDSDAVCVGPPIEDVTFDFWDSEDDE